MRIGTLDRRVSLQRKVTSQDQATEALVESWVEVANVWANVRYLNGVETVKANTPVSIARASIRVRWRDGIDETWRVVYTAAGKTTHFNISAVLPDLQGREFIDLAVESGANNG